jgi:glycosyltransferase involved in cell wall biosynthesis
VGNRDAVAHGRTGLLVPPDDPAATAGAVLTLLDDDDLRRRLADGARAELPRFDVAVAARAYDELYAELTAAAGDRRRGGRRP